MPLLDQSQLKNGLLSRLSPDDFSLLANVLSYKDCAHAEVLSRPGEAVLDLLFPETCIISVVVQTANGETAEGGLIGLEGFASASVMLGTDRSPHRVEVQVAGHGHQIKVSDILAATSRSETLRTSLLRFTQTLIVQTTYTAFSNALHPIDERLARWLLMCHDRSPSDEIALTHRFMAVMLGVRRASVTTALQVLEGNGFIQVERGYVMIKKRVALEEYAGDAYGAPEAEYRRLLGPL